MPAGTPSLVFGEFELDPARYELRRAGRVVELRATPFRLLQYLVGERGRVVPKEELLEVVWPGVTVSDTALSSALKEVRRALGDDGTEQRWIQTLRGRGIRFLGDVRERAAGPGRGARALPAGMGPHRRTEASVATILCVDLVASTELGVRRGDERARRAFESLHEGMTRVIEAHGGEPLQWSGDGVMVAFGSAADAVRAGVALQRWARHGVGGERPGLRVGLNLGELQRKESGGNDFGLSAIVASRLCDRAQAGEIFANAVVAGLLAGRRAFRFRELGALALDGADAPVAACAVEYELEGGLPLAGDMPFVGRARELARLEAALGAAEAGRGGVVFVTGTAGIGKTRLVAELAGRARERGARVLAGRCFEGEGTRPYAPFAEALDAYVAEADPAELAVDVAPHASQLAALAPRLRARLPELPELVRLGGQEERARLFSAVAELLLGAARHVPLVLWLDDLQWADGGTVALLRYVARLAGTARMLVVGSYRDDELGRDHPLALALAAMKREADTTRVALAGLAVDDVSVLVAALAEQEVGAAFSEYIAAETAGNPFFVRELLVHLVEMGALRRGEGAWTSAVPVDALGVPEGVRQVVGHRVSRLSAAAKGLLNAAAGCQGTFSFEVARRVAELGEADALDALDEALDAQLLRSAGDGGDRYEFAHDLVRHTLEALPSPSRRTRLHRRIAEAMESVYGATPGERSAEIARLYHASRELPGAERGAEHALAAAEQAERAAAAERVARSLRIALDLVSGADPRRPRILARLALALAHALHAEDAARVGIEAAERLADSEGGDVAADYVGELSRPLGLISRPLAWRLASLGLRLIGDRRDLTWAQLACLDLEHEAERPGYPGIHTDHPVRHEITRVVLAARPEAGVLRRLGLEENLALASRKEALALDTPFVLLQMGGDPHRAAVLLRESARSSLEHGDLARSGMDLTLLARVHSSWGEFPAARGCLAWAARAAATAGEGSVLHANLLNARALLAFALDEGIESLVSVAELVVERAPLDLAYARAYMRAALACGHARLGRRARALEHLARTVPALERAPGWSGMYGLVIHFAVEALWLLGCADHAVAAESNLREKVLRPDFRAISTDARLSLARLCALTGRHEEASHWFAESRAVLDEQGARPLRAISDYDEALMWVRRAEPGDAARARPILETALAQFRALGMPGWERRGLDLRNRAWR